VQKPSARLALTSLGLLLLTSPLLARSSGGIDPAALSRHVKVLASDAFAGREPGTAGEKLTTSYIIRQLAAAGVKPGGPVGRDGRRRWLQEVPMIEYRIDGPVTASFAARGKTTALSQEGELVVNTRADVDRVAIADAPIVFVGYGIDAPSKNWDDYKGVDLKGKIALVLINDPDFSKDLGGLFDGRTMTYYGRWDYKFAELARKGALGVMIVHETEPATASWESMRHFFALPQLDLPLTARGTPNCLVEGWVSHELAVQMFAAAGRDFATEKEAASSRAFHPFELAGTRFSTHFPLKRIPLVSHNVIGRLDGLSRGDENLVYSAHWDHLGVGNPDEPGDRVNHGAQDNASGVAGLIELARRFAVAPRTRRSLIFLATTGEEKGLLGATYYTLHPSAPLAATVADLNLDALDTKPRTRDISLWGRGRASLEDDVARLAKDRGRVLAMNPRFDGGYYFRADHFAFARAGVPAITLGSGVDLFEGGAAKGRAEEDEYYTHRYHRPGDRWTPALDFSGQANDLEFYYALGRSLANGVLRPDFDPKSDFRSAQDRLRAEKR